MKKRKSQEMELIEKIALWRHGGILLKWFKEALVANVTVNGMILREKALEITISVIGLKAFTA